MTEITNYRCHVCGHIGPMKTWCNASFVPGFFILLGLLFWLVPGIILMAYAWGKRYCPNCKSVGKISVYVPQYTDIPDREKKCPYCAENIKYEAVVCRYCSRELPALQIEP